MWKAVLHVVKPEKPEKGRFLISIGDDKRVPRGGRGEGLPCPFLKIGKKVP